jgi:hypothetical protein
MGSQGLCGLRRPFRLARGAQKADRWKDPGLSTNTVLYVRSTEYCTRTKVLRYGVLVCIIIVPILQSYSVDQPRMA